ncbi:hypothetical protein TREMEDRAFT_32575 [Tremella mesenterica DSM 1558]|uniref:uncharacterized protein n=1 Tax=Tremella mesenterica (strain ATCC 24925 / CBS 8224 / DSM 1558 / NBRC 9311 / NRRL Y-6157 / RJB 2259-6 / UBC 559-6) TaxID=578456 RepID=UPI0003F4928D|nr:uncharacterized protein TREMEDRAFT_32575 [Tremella mesenterica DSM 1558]EIW68408.1 hypothetical protein TREMEDRAFT_32575 [Tremella mesenterica DSM 1558]
MSFWRRYKSLSQRPRTLGLISVIFVLTVFLFHSIPQDDLYRDDHPQQRVIIPVGPQTWEEWNDGEEDTPSNKGGMGSWLKVKTPKLGLEGLGLKKGGKRSLLVTGGAGQLGLALVNSLVADYTIHIVDIAKRPSFLTKSPNIIYHRGSILPPSDTLSSLFATTSFDGVVHLAAISLEAWCEPKEIECLTVNEGGTKAVLDQLDILRQKQPRRALLSWGKRKVPWMILASSMDVYGSSEFMGGSVDETTLRQPINAIGRTKLLAEQAVEEAATRGSEQQTKMPLKAAIVRFSDVYGYPHGTTITQSFFPSLVIDAITSLPIQYSSSTPPMDLIHVDDAVAGLTKVIRRLSTQSDPNMGGLENFNIVSGGKRWNSEEIVDLVRAQTGSMSPLRDIGDHLAAFAPVAEYSNIKASTDLDWQPTTSLTVGLGRTVTALSSEMAHYTRAFHSDNCPPSADYPSLDGLQHPQPEDERNRDLSKLDGCTVGMGFNHDGWIHHVKCEDGRFCGADGNKVIAYNWNASVWIVKAQRSDVVRERFLRVRFEEETGAGTLGISEENWDAGIVKLELFPPDREDDAAILTFDIEVSESSSSLRVMIPNSEQQLHAVANTTDSSTSFVMEHLTKFARPHYDMRLTVICCPSVGDWPLLLDDFETADILYGSTGQIPFNASRRSSQCTRAAKAVEYNSNKLSSEEKVLDAMASPPQLGESLQDSLQVSTQLSKLPNDWGLAHLPPCWNECHSPTVCIQSGDCRCVKADHCRPRRENPLLYQFKTMKKNPIEIMFDSHRLSNEVKQKDWKDILLPKAKSYFTQHDKFPKVHIVNGYPEEKKIELAECHKLQPAHCFSADNILYRAMRHISVSAEEADLIVLPVYQHCTDEEFMLHDLTAFAVKTIPGVLNQDKKLAFVLTHDWGICVNFAWEIWSARGESHLTPDWILRNALVWSVMGDYNSPCYRPHQDIVVPPRTCKSIDLREHFPEITNVTPMRQRTKLVTWSGTYWGTGKNMRLRLTCERGGAGKEELVPGGGPMSSWYNWEYMKEISGARFCPQPTGIAGWSPRINDAIYAGCIPVLTAEGTHYPFADFLDWSKFSIRIKPTELDQLERILSAIPLEQLEEMQANLMLVREAFIYSTDENPEDELKRRGPMFFALHEAGMRLRTLYPVGKNGVSKDTIYRQPVKGG